MSDNLTVFPEAVPIELTSTQRQVFEVLRTAKSQKYSLADWYLGAIYATKNTNNPDRFSQAAQSLRELLEKLPRVFVESEIPEPRPDFQVMRNTLYSLLCSDKGRYEGKWIGNTIDDQLDNTIRAVYRYLKLNQKPTRIEQIHSLMVKIDPMHGALDQGIRSEKYKQFRTLWTTFEDLAHHKTNVDEKSFWEQLALTEHLIIDLLAPITAQDQGVIRLILKKLLPEQEDVDKMLGLIRRRGANYAYFFKTVDNPIWITPLVKNGFFKKPPRVEAAEDGHISTPLWWPIFYLQRVSEQEPKQVVEIILGLEQTDNPRILREIFSIACDLHDTDLSLCLKPLIMKFLKSPYRWSEEDLIIKILQKWGGCQGATRNAAYEIIRYVIAFQPDPKEGEKQTHHKERPEDWNTLLEPVPRFDQWEYQQILEKGVRPLAEHEPYQVTRLLIDAVANMIRLGMYPEDFEKGSDEDGSVIWCRRLDHPGCAYQDSKEVLVQTLTYACEQVYEKAPEFIDTLDQALRNQRWKVFRLLRQHLYALHPNDQTLLWIREQILGHNDYSRWVHRYEFQLMIRMASEHFGPRLLSEDERKDIFGSILNGPSKDAFRKWIGDRYSEEAFQIHQHYFHRMQLRPFAVLLSGEVRHYYDELEGEGQVEAINDDSYSPIGELTGGLVSFRSPKSAEDLDSLTDEELLTYLNDWNEEYRDKDHWIIEINISALADVFQSLFQEKIVQDGERLAFWLANRDRIVRPIYVATMLKAMRELIKGKTFGNLEQWIEFCAWVLSHPDTERVEGQPEPRDKSCDHPDWGSSRRAVVDFVDVCVNKDTNVPVTARNGLADLLQQVCSQFDWRLDRNRPILLNRDDPIAEAINNTRSRAFESLVNFGFWIRRHLPEDNLPEVTGIIEKRIANDAEIPLTRPERALLGMHFGNLCALDRDWAAQRREIFFPRENDAVWRDAFGSYIRFNQPAKLTFEILRDEFECAIENLNTLSADNDTRKEFIERLGQYFFAFYLWGVIPLRGDGSLLALFYTKTNGDRKRWAELFDHVGCSLRNCGRNLDKALIDRTIAFFDWRLEAAEPLELQEFTFWLEAECLDPDWRLQSYSKILDLGRRKDDGFSLHVEALNKLLLDHLASVVECFAKISDTIDKDTQIYISVNEAKPILKAGLNAEDPHIRKNAERARENLLRLGRFDYLDVE